MEQSNQFPLINVVQFQNTSLSPVSCIEDPEDRKSAMIQSNRISHISEGLVGSGKFLFDRGEWFVDSRYFVAKEFKAWAHEQHGLPEDKITIFQVGAQASDFPSSAAKYTHALDDEHIQHGGVWYVGREIQKFLNALSSQSKALYQEHLAFSNVVASHRRYPYPVRIIRSQYDVSRNHSETLRTLYRKWGLDLAVFVSRVSIREAHRMILEACSDTPVLIVDADFEPTGDPALMYELKGDEKKYVHLWQTCNRVNSAVYGHGSPKLMSLESMDFDREGEDMTTSCARHGLTVHPDIVGTHGFDQDLEGLWRTVCREVYKLKTAPYSSDNKKRLEQWTVCTNPLLANVYNDAVQFALSATNQQINDYEALRLLWKSRPGAQDA